MLWLSRSKKPGRLKRTAGNFSALEEAILAEFRGGPSWNRRSIDRIVWSSRRMLLAQQKPDRGVLCDRRG
jgi:hypothetical protein